MESLINSFLLWSYSPEGLHMQLYLAISPWGRSGTPSLPAEPGNSNTAWKSSMLAHNHMTKLQKKGLLELQPHFKAPTGKDWALTILRGCWYKSVIAAHWHGGFLLAFSQKPFSVSSWLLAGDRPQFLAGWASHIASSKPARRRAF